MTVPFADNTHWILDDRGTPKAVRDVIEWAKWFEKADRQVAFDVVGRANVSTVFLGIDHNFGGDGPPLLYETMIFGLGDEEWCERAATRDEALARHAAAIAYVRGRIQ